MFFELYYRAVGKDDLTAMDHTHVNRMEVIHIVNGTGTILLGENTYPFSSGDVFFFDGSVLHNILPAANTRYERNKLIFEKSILSVLSDINFHEHIYFRATPELSAELDSLFQEIHHCQEKAQTLLAVSLIFRLLHICKANSTSLVPADSTFRRKIMDHINEHLQDPLTIDNISDHIHMSKYHMCKRFKAETGITIGNYIRIQRLYVAKKRLAETNDPISMIALDCGFNDLAHFTKIFKTTVKMTPSAYRKQHISPK